MRRLEGRTVYFYDSVGWIYYLIKASNNRDTVELFNYYL
jgi:hypothetical protein